ncbi:MAG: hypothetical protein ABSD78_11895 [Acidimicrobiales bacterium]|jgi:hypothetical protein
MPRALVGGLAVLGLLLLVSSPASAAGDPTVDHYILSNPVPGWTQVSSADEKAALVAAEAVVSSVEHQTITIAGEGWQSSDSAGHLAVVLIAFPHTATLTPGPAGTPGGAVGQLCGAPAGVQASLSVPGVPDSAIQTCPADGVSGGVITTYVMWVQGNVIGLTEGSGLSAKVVSQIAQRESAMVPASGISLPSGLSTLEIGAIAGGAVLVVAAVVILVVRSRRSKQPAWSAAAGATGPPGATGHPTDQGWGWESYPTAVNTSAGGATSGWQPYPTAVDTSAGGAASGWQPYPTAVDTSAGGAGQQPWSASRGQRAGEHGSAQGAGMAPYRDPRIRQPAAGEVAPATAPDWYPIDGNPYLLAYWDGSAWTARRRWDGAQWVDEPEA